MRYFSLALLIIALLLMQILIGGAGLVFSLPACLILGLSGMGLAFAKRENNRSALTQWAGVSTLLLAGYVIARAYTSPVEYLARWDVFLALASLVAYFATSTYFVHARDRLIVFSALMALALVHVGIGGIQFKQQDNYMLLPWFIRSDWQSRASGFYIYPNHLAGLLEMLGMMALSICFWGRVRSWARILAGYCALMCLAGIALTGSRGGYVSTVVGLLTFCVLGLWVVRQVRRDRFAPMMAAALLGVALVLGGAIFLMTKSVAISERLATVNDPNNMRLMMWKAAIEAFQLNPVFGTGSGTYLYYGRQFRSPDVQDDPIFVHNDYLHLLTEYGVIGASLGALFLILHLLSGIRGVKSIVDSRLKAEWRTSSNELALVVGALSGMACLLVHSVVDFNFHLPANAMIGAVLFAVMSTPSTDRNPATGVRRAGLNWLAWVAPAGSVALLAQASPLMRGEYLTEMARRAVRDGQYDQARDLSQEALRYGRKNPNTYFYLGEAQHYLTLGEKDPVARAALHEMAAEAYENGLKLFPKDTRLLLKLAQTLDLAGHFPEADETYQRAIAGDPNFGNIHAYYGLHFKLMQNFEKAELYLNKARELGESRISIPALQEIEFVMKAKAQPLPDFAPLPPELIGTPAQTPAHPPAPAPRTPAPEQ